MLPYPAVPSIMWKFRSIQHMHMTRVHRLLCRHGLHFGQPQILHAVRHLNCASQKELAETLRVSPASVAMSVKRMQKAGLVEKTVNENDMRENRIRLTEKGREIVDESLFEIVSSEKQMLSGFSADEVAILGGYLDRMHQNLCKSEEPDNVE